MAVSVLLSIERALINPRCCGFKSQVPEGSHHAWVTSDVRIPQQPLSCWSFAGEAIQTLVNLRSEALDTNAGHACKIKDSIRTIALTRFRNYADLCNICVWQLLRRHIISRSSIPASLFMYLLFRRTLFGDVGVLSCLIFISNFAILVTYISSSRKQFRRDVINTPFLSTAPHLSVLLMLILELSFSCFSLCWLSPPVALSRMGTYINEIPKDVGLFCIFIRM